MQYTLVCWHCSANKVICVHFVHYPPWVYEVHLYIVAWMVFNITHSVQKAHNHTSTFTKRLASYRYVHLPGWCFALQHRVHTMSTCPGCRPTNTAVFRQSTGIRHAIKYPHHHHSAFSQLQVDHLKNNNVKSLSSYWLHLNSRNNLGLQKLPTRSEIHFEQFSRLIVRLGIMIIY